MFRHCRDSRLNVRVRILRIPVPVEVNTIAPDLDIQRVVVKERLSICGTAI